MIDSEDVWGAFSLLPESPLGFLIWLVFFAVIFFCWIDNEDACAKHSCPPGQHTLLTDHQCLCVGPVLPG